MVLKKDRCTIEFQSEKIDREIWAVCGSRAVTVSQVSSS